MIAAAGAPAAVAAVPTSPTVWVTDAELCAQTQAAVVSSPRYVAANATQRRLVDAQLRIACAMLPDSTTSSAQRALRLGLYRSAVDSLVRGGWLSSTQSTTLKALANQLHDVRPIAVISGPTSVTVGAPVSFSGALSSDPDGSVVSYAWSFGDGTPAASGIAVSHTFAAGGSFTVTLVVTDNKGASSLPVSQQVTVVLPNARPTAVISDPGAAAAGIELEFSGAESSDPDGSVTAYAWSWGDGSPGGTGAEPSHTFTTPGPYTVTLVVTDDDGATSEPATREVVVAEANDAGSCSSLTLAAVGGETIASAALAPPPPPDTVCTLLQVVPEPNDAFPDSPADRQISATGLFGAGRTAIQPAPLGTTRLTDAVQFAGFVGSSLRVCFTVPPAATEFRELRIAYYDTTPSIDRWVFLRTGEVTDGTICMTRGLRSPIPAVFTLFGNN
jgi:PKD repeat protein